MSTSSWTGGSCSRATRASPSSWSGRGMPPMAMSRASRRERAMSTVVDLVKPEARPYIEAFAETASEPRWLRDIRQRGLARFGELGFPSRRSESWRYLDLQPLEKKPLLPATPGLLDLVPRELGFDSAWA